jgi:thiazole/oxazole-forming peptide maturase SagD family component
MTAHNAVFSGENSPVLPTNVDLEISLKNLTKLCVDSESGPVSTVLSRTSPMFEDLGLNMVFAVSRSFAYCRHTVPIYGVGKGSSNIARRGSAIGECVERFVFRNNKPKLRGVSVKELRGEHLNLKDVVGFDCKQYNSDQFQFKAPDENLRVDWSLARSLETGESIYTPFESGSGQRMWYRPTTSGWAAGMGAQADLRALLEIIERDALMLAWSSHDFSRRTSIPNSDLVSAIGKHGFALTAYNVTSDVGVPVILLRATAAKDIGRVSAGANLFSSACALRKVEAIASAVCGIAQKIETCIGAPYEPKTCDKVKEPVDHIAFYLDPANARCLQAMDVSLEISESTSEAAYYELQDVVDALLRSGYTAYIVDEGETILDIPELKVKRAIVPGLIPHSFGQMRDMRLRGTQKNALRRARIDKSVRPNIYPHPFA